MGYRDDLLNSMGPSMKPSQSRGGFMFNTNEEEEDPITRLERAIEEAVNLQSNPYSKEEQAGFTPFDKPTTVDKNAGMTAQEEGIAQLHANQQNTYGYNPNENPEFVEQKRDMVKRDLEQRALQYQQKIAIVDTMSNVENARAAREQAKALKEEELDIKREMNELRKQQIDEDIRRRTEDELNKKVTKLNEWKKEGIDNLQKDRELTMKETMDDPFAITDDKGKSIHPLSEEIWAARPSGKKSKGKMLTNQEYYDLQNAILQNSASDTQLSRTQDFSGTPVEETTGPVDKNTPKSVNVSDKAKAYVAKRLKTANPAGISELLIDIQRDPKASDTEKKQLMSMVEKQLPDLAKKQGLDSNKTRDFINRIREDAGLEPIKAPVAKDYEQKRKAATEAAGKPGFGKTPLPSYLNQFKKAGEVVGEGSEALFSDAKKVLNQPASKMRISKVLEGKSNDKVIKALVEALMMTPAGGVLGFNENVIANPLLQNKVKRSDRL